MQRGESFGSARCSCSAQPTNRQSPHTISAVSSAPTHTATLTSAYMHSLIRTALSCRGTHAYSTCALQPVYTRPMCQATPSTAAPLDVQHIFGLFCVRPYIGSSSRTFHKKEENAQEKTTFYTTLQQQQHPTHPSSTTFIRHSLHWYTELHTC